MASSISPICSWSFLDPSHKPNQKVSFANVLKNGSSSSKSQPFLPSTINALQSINIPLSTLPTPTFNGDTPCIKIDEETYQSSLLKCKSKLLGRLIIARGKQPIKSEELHLLLSSIWNLKQPWKLTPKGKGFYSLCFDSLLDMEMVWSLGPLKLDFGFFKPLKWCADFKPSSFVSSFAHV